MKVQKKLPLVLAIFFLFTGCEKLGMREPAEEPPRLALFVGLDISGSFMHSRNFEDSLDFLSYYLYAHLKGYGGLEVPAALFVGSIGGDKINEPKTLFPIQTFEGKSQKEIRQKLAEIFPKKKMNPYTDFNAFFNQVANTVINRKLVLKPISIVLVSDGMPDVPIKKGLDPYRKIDFSPLENLSRNVTIRLLYTDAVTGGHWQTQIPRNRIKVWTQDAAVMRTWREPANLPADKSLEDQKRFFAWLKDNTDFAVRARRVR